MFSTLPQDAIEFATWPWIRIAPYYEDLAARELDAGGVHAWLADWSRIGELLGEAGARLYVATTCDTTDEQAISRYHAFLEDVLTPAEAAEQRLKEKLLASGLEPGGLEIMLRNLRAEAALFREANLPLFTEEHKLGTAYNQIIGAQTVQWDGAETTLPQLTPILQQAERPDRERIWRLAAARQLEDRAALNALWQKLLALRRQLAANAGYADYRSFRWQQLQRFDYTPESTAQFRQAIEEVVVPAAVRVYARAARRLGLDALRPWDLRGAHGTSAPVDPPGTPALQPFAGHDFGVTSLAIFRRVDPALGEYFDLLRREGLIDLDNRKGKAPGAYCTNYSAMKRPFIFMNSVGVHDDVQTLLHEAGHAFHVFESNALPYVQQREVGSEFAEVASMSMELLAAPYLAAAEGGFYAAPGAARARAGRLDELLLFWPYMAVVDGFQDWVYTHPDDAMDTAQCDAQWDALWRRFMPGVDWTGLEAERMTGWQRKLHIFTHPFYYVEYGLAQLGAVQVWRNSLRDQAGAIAAYRRALALGGTVPIPQLFAAAGARFAFDAGTLRDAVGLIEDTLAQLAA